MKAIQYRILGVLIPVMFFLAGCGGGGGNDLPDATSDPSMVNVEPLGARMDGHGQLTKEFRVEQTSPGTVELKNFSFDASGRNCTIDESSVKIDPSSITIFPTTIRVTAQTIPTDCKLENYRLSYDEVITASKHSKRSRRTIQGEIFGEENNSSDVGDSGSSGRFSIYPDENLTVTQTNHEYSIKVGVEKIGENGLTEPAVGETVTAEYLQPKYGSILQYKVEVGSNGIAEFKYQSPDSLSGLNFAELTFHVQKNSTVSGTTRLLFRPGSVEQVDKLYVLPRKITITRGGEEKNITILTLNADGVGLSSTVSIPDPSDGGTSYGYFSPGGQVNTNSEGRLAVIYYAPDSIAGLQERNVTITDKSGKTQILTIDFNQATQPGEGLEYEISGKTPTSLRVDGMDQLALTINVLGDENRVIDDDNVHEVNVTSLYPNMLTFVDDQSQISYSGKGTKAVRVLAHKLSGTAVVEVSASIFNGMKDVVIKKRIPVVILSGPVAAMSIFYAFTTEDEDQGIFKNIFTIHAVDKYDNPAQAGIALHPSIINGTKVIRARVQSGTISPSGDSALFEDANVSFDDANVSADEDLLAIIPNAVRYSKDYLGNWSIDDVSTHQLQLAEKYFGAAMDQLSYVIGNSKRYLSGYGVAAVDIKDRNNNGFLTDANGTVQFEVTFDPALAGHTVTISANAYDAGNRTGVSKIVGLRWNKYSSTSKKVSNDGNPHVIALNLGIDNGREPLINVDIVPTSITSSSPQCTLVLGQNSATDLHTDPNGGIVLEIATKGTDSEVKECTITWSKKQSGIYLEY